jgi:hypothetical protein
VFDCFRTMGWRGGLPQTFDFRRQISSPHNDSSSSCEASCSQRIFGTTSYEPFCGPLPAR